MLLVSLSVLLVMLLSLLLLLSVRRRRGWRLMSFVAELVMLALHHKSNRMAWATIAWVQRHDVNAGHYLAIQRVTCRLLISAQDMIMFYMYHGYSHG